MAFSSSRDETLARTGAAADPDGRGGEPLRGAPAALVAFAHGAYAGNPLPPVFKDRLAVHLARAVGAVELAAWHLARLLGRAGGEGGITPPPADDVAALVSRPARLTDGALAAALDRVERAAAPEFAVDGDLEPDREADLFAAIGAFAFGGPQASRARRAVATALGDTAVERIGLLAGYVVAAQAHLAGREGAERERDVRALLDDAWAALLLAAHPTAAAAPTHDPELLQLALDSTAQGTWDYDVAADRPSWDARTFALFGLPPAAPLSYARVLEAYVHPDDRDRVDRAARAAMDPAGDGRYEVEHRVRRADDGAERWLAVTGRTLFAGAPGARRPVRMLGVVRDVTAEVEARRRADTYAERLRHALEAAEASAWEWAPEDPKAWWSPENFALFGLDPGAGVPTFEEWLERCVHPDDRTRLREELTAALTGDRDDFVLDYRVLHPERGERWITARGRIRRDGDGAPRHLLGLNVDSTARRRAEEALGHSRALLDRQFAELQALYAQAPLGLGMLDRELRFVRINRALAEINGFSVEEHLGRVAWELLPDLKASAEPVFRKVLDSGEAQRDVSVRGTTPAQPGAEREWREHFYPIADRGGAVLGIGIVCEEVTAARRAERQRELLIDELNHRVKNTLAVAQALAHQTFKPGVEPVAASAAFRQRLQALAGAHQLLTRSNWESASLADLVADVVRDASPAGVPVRAEGPAVTVAPKMAVTLAMTLHELHTNAVKYGALAAEGGRIELSWRYSSDGADGVALVWRERGGPAVTPPTRRGFGLTMIEQALAREFGAVVAVDFPATGLVCRIELPLDRRGSAPS